MLPTFGNSMCGSSRIAVPCKARRSTSVGAKIQRPFSRTANVIRNVLEKPTIQYTETSRAKSSSVLGVHPLRQYIKAVAFAFQDAE